MSIATGSRKLTTMLVSNCGKLTLGLALCIGACGLGEESGETSPLVLMGGTGGFSGLTLFTQSGTDTMLVENSATNLDSRTSVTVCGDGPEPSQLVVVGLFKWRDLTICNIASASITFDVRSPSAETYSLYRANRPWLAHEANWTNASLSQPWAVPGALGSADRGPPFQDFTPSSVGSMTIPLNSAGVALVQTWVNQGTNNGIIVGHLTHTDPFTVHSFNTATLTSRPRLTYTCR